MSARTVSEVMDLPLLGEIPEGIVRVAESGVRTRADIERLLRRRNQRNTHQITRLTNIDNITELTTLDHELEPDIDIIATLQD